MTNQSLQAVISLAERSFQNLLTQPSAANIPLKSQGRVLLIADSLTKLVDAQVLLANSNAKVKPVLRNENSQVEAVGKTAANDLSTLHIKESCVLSGVFTKFMLKGKEIDAVDKGFSLSADMVIDLCERTLLPQQTPRTGYFSELTETVVAEIDALTGEFLKPIYIQVNNSVCAYGNGSLDGCRACLSACEFDAVKVEQAKIYIDHELCQGSGGCAAVCPSNAINYQQPNRQSFVNLLRITLNEFIHSTKERPTLRFVASTAGVLATENQGVEIVIPVDEQDWLDAPILLLALCYGASSVIVEKANPQNKAQIELANHLLLLLGYQQAIYTADQLPFVSQSLNPEIRLLERASSGDRHSDLYLAMDHLFAQLDLPTTVLELPYQANLGEILIQTHDCTLCLSCVAVCPSLALKDMGDKPGLLFKEQNCLQCGLCESACPEKVITLNPRIELDKEKRQHYRVLHEDKIFECIRCHTPFATEKMIATIEKKLGSHAMFADRQAKIRLRMCADCRVKDMME